MADAIVILNEQQLRQLARLIYVQEVEAIQNLNFSSESEVAGYLRDCKSNYDSVVGLLDSGGEVVRKYEKDSIRAPIARDIFSYIVYCGNCALQAVRNYTLRMNYLDKISNHAASLISDLQELDSTAGNVSNLAKDVVLCRDTMLEYTKNHQSIASTNYSKWLKESSSGFKFDLLERYKTKVEFTGGSFNDLEDEVYDQEISEDDKGSTLKGICGIAALLFKAVKAPLSTDGLRCYVSEMPDGVVLARQIAHQHYKG